MAKVQHKKKVDKDVPDHQFASENIILSHHYANEHPGELPNATDIFLKVVGHIELSEAEQEIFDEIKQDAK